ncbi:alpha/beta fold hydrolase [Streptomyces sporangiiformans]|uniref:Alpha/beta hydrolase n=1 Tax=Streptomyces sporangiiformans TaxID=2315329 RepID=A0A505D0U4_9ACTN|nr:alpha/beta hydrolase [Streptomyces sporangiiformans]TPQ17973.1 alpha/beta hydrolase [Streptomyces sporangiiformans]
MTTEDREDIGMETDSLVEDGIRSVTVTGAGGVPLNVLDAGPEDAPAVILLHGFAQSARSWLHQLTAPGPIRVVAPDLRGHGHSGKPDSGCLDERVWADDVAAVIEGLRLDRPVLGGWSYGGLVALDYVAVHGDSALSGLLTVDASLLAGVPGAERMFGPDFVALLPELVNDDGESTVEARRKLLEVSTERPLADDTAQTLLDASLLTPPRVCAALLQRPLDRSAAAAGVTVPWLAVQGGRDRIVAPAAAEHIAAVQPAAQVRLWEGSGHSPFLEEPDLFNEQLIAFVTRSASGA